MRKSVLILGAVALVMAGGTVFFVNNFLQAEKTKTQVVKKGPKKKKQTYVLVAAESLQPGAYLRSNQVRWQVWPAGRVSKTYITRVGRPNSKTDARVRGLRNSVVRLLVPAGQPITEAALVAPGDRGFLAAVLKPGMRGVSIAINAATGVSGLAFPGDRVDLIWVYGIKQRRGRDTVQVAETLLVGVRLLAIGQDLGHVEVQPGTKTKDKKGGKARGKKIRRATTATIELTPKQAEMLAVAMTKGRITLSLNSLARPTEKRTHLITAANSDQTLKGSNDSGHPLRGRTFTMEQHVSRLISYAQRQGPTRQEVIVVRGGKSEKAGSVKKKNKAKNPDDPDDDDEEGQE